MGVQIRYMGAKHHLAPRVVRAMRGLPAGPCLDLFSGMCSVAGAIAATGRPAWCNDVQHYAALVARVIVTSQEGVPPGEHTVRVLHEAYATNLRALSDRFRGDLLEEEHALAAEEHLLYAGLLERWPHVGNDDALATEAQTARRSDGFPYRLATLTYAHGYFGLRQCIQLDSLRYAIDSAYAAGMITDYAYEWYLVAFLQAANHIVTAPGHFAQFFRVRDNASFRRVRKLRSRSVWNQFLIELERVAPYGSAQWRMHNRVFCAPAETLLQSLRDEENRPAIIYADPPYSKDQYSRYYHVLESLTRYDYPDSHGIGRYRTERFVTPFSHKTRVRGAFESLVAGAAALGSALVISYPPDGLLADTDCELTELLAEQFNSVRTTQIEHRHSTMGGSPGRMHTVVQEMVYVASNPR